MSACVAQDVNGFLYVTAEVYPQCAEFVAVTPAHVERLTYWADVAIALDPAGTDLYVLMSATLLVFAVAFGWKAVARQIFNR